MPTNNKNTKIKIKNPRKKLIQQKECEDSKKEG